MSDVLTEISGNTGFITLNRPQALNSLNLSMILGMAQALRDWEHSDQINTIVFRGAGGRAFCAGGDIKAAHAMGSAAKLGKTAMHDAHMLFGSEYRLNRQLYHYPKDHIALMDGIVMGGGFGIAGPCKYRVATEKTVFAMPEVGIGLFPDVGSVYYLNRCPGQMGAYLTVTGNSIGPADMIYGNLASHFVASDKISDIKNTDDLKKLSSPAPGESIMKKKFDVINNCFAFDKVEHITAALRAHPDPWARETLDVIMTRSPLSMKISLAHLRWAKKKNFDDVIAADFNLVQHVLEGDEFYEGVRALAIDKDKQPKWNPPRLEDVGNGLIGRYFLPRALTLDNLEKP